VGSGGGGPANCTAPRNATCGPAAKTYTYSETFPAGSYCSFGGVIVPAAPIPGGSTTWTCQGTSQTAGGGSAANCTATRTTDPLAFGGVCGTANGTPASIKPTTASELCSVGTPSIVSVDADHPIWAPPWRWTCTGSPGGATDNCATVIDARDDYSRFCNPLTTSYTTCGSYVPRCHVTDISSGQDCRYTMTSTIKNPPTNLCSIGVPTTPEPGSGIGYYPGASNWVWYCKSPDGTVTSNYCFAHRFVETPCGYCGCPSSGYNQVDSNNILASISDAIARIVAEIQSMLNK
jgi:hypothetical protein